MPNIIPTHTPCLPVRAWRSFAGFWSGFGDHLRAEIRIWWMTR
jgi:hypothetical protein